MSPTQNMCRWRAWLAAGALAMLDARKRRCRRAGAGLGAAGRAAHQAAQAAQAADANNPATHPVQPFAGIASENIFNVPRRDIAAEARSQRDRSVTQPGNNAPVWREINSDQAHYSSLPAKEAGVLIQRTGQQWRLFRNGVITVWGGWLLVIVPLAILGFFAWRGMIRCASRAPAA
ncbi:hypothetical protein ACTMU2_38895 [Cupriavidus basilensis]